MRAFSFGELTPTFAEAVARKVAAKVDMHRLGCCGHARKRAYSVAWAT